MFLYENPKKCIIMQAIYKHFCMKSWKPDRSSAAKRAIVIATAIAASLLGL